MSRSWTGAEVKRLISMRSRGIAFGDIAKVTERSLHAVISQAYRNRGSISAEFVRKTWTKEEETAALKLKKQGLTNRAIAETIGRTRKSVLNKFYKIRAIDCGYDAET